MNTVSARNEDSLFFEPGIDDDEDIFAFDAGRTLSEQEIQRARESGLGAESSHGGRCRLLGNAMTSKAPSWIYHVIVPRKAMVHPGKTPGAIAKPPDLSELLQSIWRARHQ